MKLELIVLALAIVVAICEAKKCKQYSKEEIDEEFDKNYKKGGKEFKRVEAKTKKPKTKGARKSIFSGKMKGINKHNAGDPSYCQGPNQFTAMDEEEFEKGYLGKERQTEEAGDAGKIPVKRALKTAVPASADHSAATGPVENQGGCGSCWAFSASHSVGGTMAALKGFPPTAYSEEQILDCSLPADRDGCQGADAFYGYDYLKTHEFKTDDEYKYEGKSSNCTATNAGTNFPLKGWARTHPFGTVNVEAIKQQLAKQPMAVATYVVSSFQSYKGGIYDQADCATGTALNHDMVIVGYGEENGVPYWKIKNSWGTTYGENGYARVKMGANVCNVEIDIRYPIPSDTATAPATPATPAPTPAPTTCVDEAKDCAHYGSEACVKNTYQGDKTKTKDGTPCVEGRKCSNPDGDQAPWCYTGSLTDGAWGYCFNQC